MLSDIQASVHWGLWGLFVSSFISATLAPGGSELLLAYLLSRENEPAWLLWLVATTGNTLGGASSFVLGLLVSKGRLSPERLLPNKNQKALTFLHCWGASALLLSWLPVLGDLLCVFAGWMRLSVLASVAAMSVGKGLRYAGVVYLYSWVDA